MTNTKTNTNTRVGGTVLARALSTAALTRGSGEHSPLGIPRKGAIMMMRRVLAMTVLILGMGVAAHADILAAGAMYGGGTQSLAVCYLFNAGTGPVTVVTGQIFREPGTILPLLPPGCPVILAANTSCAIYTNIAYNAAHSCKFVLSPSAADVRGSFELRAGNGQELNNAELR